MADMIGGGRETIMVLCLCNDPFSMYLAVMLKSLEATHRSGEAIEVTVIDGGTTEMNKERIMGPLRSGKVSVRWLGIGSPPCKDMVSSINRLKLTNLPNHMTYYRMLAPYLFPKDVKRAIFLDSDLVINADIAKLWNTDLGGKTAGAVQDPFITHVSKPGYGIANYRELGLGRDDKYFNTGVLLMDLEKWREQGITEKAIGCIRENRDFVRFEDQYGLNVVLAGKWKELDARWNVQSASESGEAPYIVHYISRKRADSTECREDFRNLFYKYIDLTEWRGWRPRRIIRYNSVYVRKAEEFLDQAKDFLGLLDKSGSRISDSIIQRLTPHSFGRKDVEYSDDEFAVVCLAKDGGEFVDQFIEHYSRLGAKHIFFMVDAGSADGTADLIKKHPNTSIYTSHLPFRHFECGIRRAMARKLCGGRWCLFVDIDELFDFPLSDRISMAQFLHYLNRNRFTAAAAYMLDMFPKKPLAEITREEGRDLEGTYRYYDISHVVKEEYLNALTEPLCGENELSDGNIRFCRGGVRKFAMGQNGAQFWLIKHPLMFIDEKIMPFSHPHFCDNARVADVSCLLRHYKLTRSLPGKVAMKLREGGAHPHYMDEMRAYADFFRKGNTLYSKSSEMFRGAGRLLQEGFLYASDNFRAYSESCAKGNGP